jgi:acyl carrier protein
MDPLSRVLAIVREAVAPGAEVGPDSLAREVRGWDSGAMVQILFDLEEAFGFTLTSQEMEGVDGVPDLLALVRARAE